MIKNYIVCSRLLEWLRHIYNGGIGLEKDLDIIQNAICQKENTVWEKDKMDVSAWIELEGKCIPDFLHLEDIKH